MSVVYTIKVFIYIKCCCCCCDVVHLERWVVGTQLVVVAHTRHILVSDHRLITMRMMMEPAEQLPVVHPPEVMMMM